MATDRRVSRVASQIKREVSLMLLNDIKDDRVGAGMVTVTDVDVSGDLQHAKIFVSIYGTTEARAETMAGLKSATGFVRSELGHRVRLRRTPEVVFLEDRSLERGDRILSLINQISSDRKPDDLLEINGDEGNDLSETDGDEGNDLSETDGDEDFYIISAEED
ncbi:30S ribosome-binding factor RbfA [Microcoleus sp. FACHB-68]|uniref:30S ribosome-binding factor RbfA n=1 Tax=Microcoleus sp. FACHB-68 TaxID=2692826 RepID=UPI001684B611|nr:30S ribosome-binding factor RbfA [Microcoleus sp. FACHB-68]MBD1939826.1 30S ribosome-binding factor RbfA [Microcoleus sp. FACHB-68]